MPVIHNKESTFTVHATANATLTIAGNSAVSNVAYPSTQVVTSASIRQVWWGTGDTSTSWAVKRGSNTVLVLNGSDHFNFAAEGKAIDIDKGGTLVLEKTGGTGFLMIELSKA